MARRVVIGIAIALAACRRGPAEPVTAPIGAAQPELPMSDPAEYGIDRISRDAGEAIFARTGIGDPYRTGVPYPVFLALQRAYPAILGADPQALAERFGFIARAPDPTSADLDRREGLPVGLHLTIDPITGVPFLVTACAACHAERLRWPGGEALVIGLGNKRVQIHAYDRAFAQVTRARGFTTARLTALATTAAADHGVAWPPAYRATLTAATVGALTARAAQRAALHARTAADPPGRVATIESFAVVLASLTQIPIVPAPEVGWAKIPDVIGYAQRTTLSWDGSGQGPIDLLAVEADVAAGVRVAWLERHPFQGASLGAYLRQPAPRPAFPGSIDHAAAARGQALFAVHCTPCHGTYAADGRVTDYTESIVAIEDLGTDPARLMAPTESFERAANDPALTRGYTRFQRSAGYVPPILTNVWARGPYGHAGQWPSLAVLALPPAQRPTRFTVDAGGLYDLDAVGVPTGGARGYAYDATRPGFAVGGHPFLADLGADAGDVIEYLKTL
jgi:mono/diheme cytochrome c family protein